MRLSTAMEEALGMTVFSFCFALVPYYSLNMQHILLRSDYHKLVRHILKTIAYITVLFTAAEANSTVSI